MPLTNAEDPEYRENKLPSKKVMLLFALKRTEIISRFETASLPMTKKPSIPSFYPRLILQC